MLHSVAHSTPPSCLGPLRAREQVRGHPQEQPAQQVATYHRLVPLTEDDISSIVTAVVQALPGDRDHTSREEEESADSSEVVEQSTASRNNPASNDPHDFGELTVLYLSLLYGHT